MTFQKDHITRAKEGWVDAPDWVLALAQAAQASSLSAIAKRFGVSPSMISAVIGGNYGASTERIEELTRGAFMSATVECPALGTMPLDTCHGWRKKAQHFSGANAMRARMFRACRNCTVRKERPTEGDDA